LRRKYALVLFLAAAAVAAAAGTVAGNFNRTVEPKEPLCIFSVEGVQPWAWKVVFLNQEVEVDLGSLCRTAGVALKSTAK